MSDPKSYRPSNLPTEPGVYHFFDKDDKVIYVGKAKNIKNRLNSYFGSNSGLFIKANDNSINSLLVLENTQAAANYGVSINFNLSKRPRGINSSCSI